MLLTSNTILAISLMWNFQQIVLKTLLLLFIILTYEAQVLL